MTGDFPCSHEHGPIEAVDALEEGPTCRRLDVLRAIPLRPRRATFVTVGVGLFKRDGHQMSHSVSPAVRQACERLAI